MKKREKRNVSAWTNTKQSWKNRRGFSFTLSAGAESPPLSMSSLRIDPPLSHPCAYILLSESHPCIFSVFLPFIPSCLEKRQWVAIIYSSLSLSLSLSLSSDLYLYLKPHHTLKSSLPMPFSRLFTNLCVLWPCECLLQQMKREQSGQWRWCLCGHSCFFWLYTGRKKNRRWRQHDRWKDRQRQHGQIVGGGDSWVMCWRGVETMLCEMRISTPEWTQEKKTTI